MKKFKAVWGVDFAKQNEKVVDYYYFKPRMGYNDEDRRAISQLKVGETWTSSDYSTHKVTRIE